MGGGQGTSAIGQLPFNLQNYVGGSSYPGMQQQGGNQGYQQGFSGYGQQGGYNAMAQDMSNQRMGQYGFGGGGSPFSYQPYYGGQQYQGYQGGGRGGAAWPGFGGTGGAPGRYNTAGQGGYDGGGYGGYFGGSGFGMSGGQSPYGPGSYSSPGAMPYGGGRGMMGGQLAQRGGIGRALQQFMPAIGNMLGRSGFGGGGFGGGGYGGGGFGGGGGYGTPYQPVRPAQQVSPYVQNRQPSRSAEQSGRWQPFGYVE